MSWRRLSDPRGEIGRAHYLLLGLALVGLKFACDAAICRLIFHQPWNLNAYFLPPPARIQVHQPLFVWTILTVAAPFAWCGVCLTVQRLRSINVPLWGVVLFFFPLVKFVFFALLVLLPARSPRDPRLPPPLPDLRGRLPDNPGLSALLACGIASLLGAICVGLFLHWRNYAVGLFIGTPFFMGMVAGVIHHGGRPRPLWQSVVVVMFALLLVGALLLAVAMEGALCIIMAAPLAVCEAVTGAFVAHLFSETLRRRRAATFSLAALWPLLLFAEPLTTKPPLFSVTSEVVIDAPPARVWPHVIGFARIPPPTELIFRAGVAYPIRAVIDGRGVGATRHCVFSTGEFVEPITVWEEPAQLAFDVAAQPDPLRELSPYSDLHPPHLRGFFRSEHGEFRLVALPGGRTLLRGTTWYSDRIAPAFYWRFWSDHLIHRIHQRVLEHIRVEVETARS